jgi:hypothetical protein
MGGMREDRYIVGWVVSIGWDNAYGSDQFAHPSLDVTRRGQTMWHFSILVEYDFKLKKSCCPLQVVK